MICVPRITDHVNVGTMDRGFIDVAKSLEVTAHPAQEIFRWVVFLGWSGGDLP
jgi:hypothetical protein